MFNRKIATRDNSVDPRQAASLKDAPKVDTARNDRCDVNASWNSWGERNPLSFGSFGRW